jgi:hypothetical protein
VCARQSNTQVTHISMPQRPPPPDGAKNLVLLVLDSCRYDSFMAAKPRIMSQLGEVQRRFSYASWTSPGHFNLLMGLLPHPSPTQIVASDYYKRELGGFAHRLGIDQMGLTDMIPRLWLPDFLRNRLGYSTHAIMSMPILNPHTPLNADFDSYVLADSHNDLRAMIPQLQFNEDRPSFYLLNTGETHYPYATPDEPEDQWPRIHGVHGVFKRMGGGPLLAKADASARFDQDKLDILRKRQIRTVQHIDSVVEELIDHLPRGTHLIITADHGELFGEAGYFGHGPINHEKVLEVPLVEGVV